MSASTSFVLCCILVAGGIGVSQGSRSQREYDEWLQGKYSQATSVKVGMTRADLLKVFRMDGGLQRLGIPTRYVLRNTSLIKVDVEFEKPANATKVILPEDLKLEAEGEPEKYQIVPNEELKITAVSRPYLEPFSYD
jgi:hypothetical protein